MKVISQENQDKNEKQTMLPKISKKSTREIEEEYSRIINKALSFKSSTTNDKVWEFC